MFPCAQLSTTRWRHEVYIHTSLFSALGVGEWSVPFPGRFNPGKSRSYPLNRRMDGPTLGLDAVEKKSFSRRQSNHDSSVVRSVA
jgi:hypothetical protein